MNSEKYIAKHDQHPSNQPPPIRGSKYNSANLTMESCYQIEKEKLLWILNKYYLYRDNLLKLKDQLEQKEILYTLEDLKKELDKMPLYTEIKPASPFSGPMFSKAKLLTIIFFIPICIIVITIMI